MIYLSPFHKNFLPLLFFSVFVFFVCLSVCLFFVVVVVVVVFAFPFPNYRSLLQSSILLLLHLITTHLGWHLSLSSIISTISTLIIGIFYYLNNTSLLLHPAYNTPRYVLGNYYNKNQWYRDISKFKQETSSEKLY